MPGFGNTSTVEVLANVPWISAVKYFNKFVDYFVQLGYERGKSIRAAPYDWRLSPGDIIMQIIFWGVHMFHAGVEGLEDPPSLHLL